MNKTIDSKIIEKISKLLALSESSNPNEAALALARAQKLMQEHSISANDLSFASIVEQSENIPSIIKDSRLYSLLAGIVSKAFGVQSIFNYEGRSIKKVTFIGSNERTPSACYIFTIIARQLAIAKKNFLTSYRQEKLEYCIELFSEYDLEHVKSLTELYRHLPHIKSYIESHLRKDVKAYLHGWLAAVYTKVNEFVVSEQETLLLEQYFEANYPNLSSMRSRRTRYDRSQLGHFQTGKKDGEEGVNLFHGVSGDMNRRELGYRN